MLRFKVILHPTDHSEAAMQSLQLAHSLARDHGARLVIVGVAPPILPTPEVYVAVDEINELIEKERRKLASVAGTITDVPVEFHARHGAAGSVITELADQAQADLIVMGTTGRSGIARFLMGSVAEYVMRHAHCPVLTVKPGKNERMPVDEPAVDSGKNVVSKSSKKP
jgi:nucleotide-binding universal stress UspA family protein